MGRNTLYCLGKLWIILLGKPFLNSLFLGIAVLVFGAMILNLPEVIASANWPAIEGVIIFSEVHEGCCGEYHEGWWPSVSYRYSVDGREYISDNIEVTDFSIGNIGYFARQVIQRYPVGECVKVYYNPENPAIAVLEPGVPDNDGGIWLILMFAVICMGVVLLGTGLLGLFRFKGMSVESLQNAGTA